MCAKYMFCVKGYEEGDMQTSEDEKKVHFVLLRQKHSIFVKCEGKSWICKS